VIVVCGTRLTVIVVEPLLGACVASPG
jgi:hypothetical protein